MTGHELTLALGSTRTGDGLIGFEGGGRHATSRLIDGDFPRVRGLIPAESAITSTVTVDTAALLEAVKRVALVAERSAPVRLTFANGTASLDAGNGEEAQASEAVDATLIGEPVTTGFNAGYLLDGLASLGAPVAHFAFTQSTKPANLTGLRSPDDSPSTDSAYILMPMRLPN
jgi:DNA polymerase III subunit beta